MFMSFSVRVSSLLTGRAALRYGPFFFATKDLRFSAFLLLTAPHLFRNVLPISRPVRRGDKNLKEDALRVLFFIAAKLQEYFIS